MEGYGETANSMTTLFALFFRFKTLKSDKMLTSFLFRSHCCRYKWRATIVFALPGTIPNFLKPCMLHCLYFQSSNWVDRVDMCTIAMFICLALLFGPFGCFFLLCLPTASTRRCNNCSRPQDASTAKAKRRLATVLIIVIAIYVVGVSMAVAELYFFGNISSHRLRSRGG